MENKTVTDKPIVNSDNKSQLFTISTIIAISSALLYFFSFLYEYGYCIYFRIPLEFIEPSLSGILQLGAYLIFLLPVAYFVLNNYVAVLFLNDSEANEYLWIGKVFVTSIVLPIIVNFLFPSSDWKQHSLIFAISFLSINSILWLPYLILFVFSKKSHQQRITTINSLPAVLQNTFSLPPVKREYIVTFLILFFISIFCVLLGGSRAKKQTMFATVKTLNDTKVVLRKYNDILICASLDTSSRSIDKAFTLIKISNLDSATIKVENVGPL